MSGKSGKSNRRGFTLTEVLAVVAVLAIVAALAIPAVVKNWWSAKLTKWDETAREIFLSAQNETSEIKAAGLLQEMVQSESNTATTTTTVQLTSSSENAEAYFPQTRTLLSTAGGSYVLDAILVAIAIPTFTGALNKAKKSADDANIRAAYAQYTVDKMIDENNATASVSAASSTDVTAAFEKIGVGELQYYSSVTVPTTGARWTGAGTGGAKTIAVTKN
jgi:prepilin-type N-terminal cleavage/methylation domain-containing protein